MSEEQGNNNGTTEEVLWEFELQEGCAFDKARVREPNVHQFFMIKAKLGSTAQEQKAHLREALGFMLAATGTKCGQCAPVTVSLVVDGERQVTDCATCGGGGYVWRTLTRDEVFAEFGIWRARTLQRLEAAVVNFLGYGGITEENPFSKVTPETSS